MGYLGYKPADKPLTSADITDSIITSAKIVDGTIVNGDISNSTIALAKLSATGTADSTTFLRGDNTWGSAGAAAGQVIQVLSATDSTSRSTTSGSFVTASNTLSVSITPASTSNKILIIATAQIYSDGDNSCYTLYRGSTNLGTSNGMSTLSGNTGYQNMSLSYLDSPSTTSATTYQVYIRTAGASTTAYLQNSTSKSSITCLEIKG